MLHIMTGQVPAWRCGRRTPLAALSETRNIDFPRFGNMTLWNMGHSEPMTVPRFLDIDEVNFFMGYGPGSGWLVRPARWGCFRNSTLRRWGVKLLAALERRTRPAEPGIGALRIDVWGTKTGEPVHQLVCGIGQMREATGLALAVGARMLARRELTVTEPGLYAPEGCIDPVSFIRRLRGKGIDAYSDLAMTAPIDE